MKNLAQKIFSLWMQVDILKGRQLERIANSILLQLQHLFSFKAYIPAACKNLNTRPEAVIQKFILEIAKSSSKSPITKISH